MVIDTKKPLTPGELNRFCVLSNRHIQMTLTQFNTMIFSEYHLENNDNHIDRLFRITNLLFGDDALLTLSDIKRLLDILIEEIVVTDTTIYTDEIERITIFLLRRYLKACGKSSRFMAGTTNANPIARYVGALFPTSAISVFRTEVCIDNTVIDIPNKITQRYLHHFDSSFGYKQVVSRDNTLENIEKFIADIKNEHRD